MCICQWHDCIEVSLTSKTVGNPKNRIQTFLRFDEKKTYEKKKRWWFRKCV
jgi:hypothetical protein